jgi:hypothetical protein
MAAVKVMVFLHGTAIMHAAAARPGRAVHCVVVPEFGGLAHLPDDVSYLGWDHDNSGH